MGKRKGKEAPEQQRPGVPSVKPKFKTVANQRSGPQSTPAARGGLARLSGKRGSILSRLEDRLSGGRFRWLNEQLYTASGSAALSMMNRDPELMREYHAGFAAQTASWPQRPLDLAAAWLRKHSRAWAVADIGCGEAELARLAPQENVRSFDLLATAPGVVACDMTALPLEDASVNAAVFCLSLMGTDYGRAVEEAVRVVEPGGYVWIAEVASRFASEDKDSRKGLLGAFLAACAARGLAVEHQDLSNTHFIVLVLKKAQQNAGGKARRSPWPPLRPCLYRKR